MGGFNTPQWFNRVTYNARKKEVKQQLKKAEAKANMDKFCAINDPNLHKKSPGFIHKTVFGNSPLLNSSSAMFKRTGEFGLSMINQLRDKDLSLKSTFANSLGFTATLAIATTTGIVGLPFRGLGKIISLVKGKQ